MNLDCKKCGAAMPPERPITGAFRHATFITTAFLCAKCGHWNDLKKRKGWAEHKAGLSTPKEPIP